MFCTLLFLEAKNKLLLHMGVTDPDTRQVQVQSVHVSSCSGTWRSLSTVVEFDPGSNSFQKVVKVAVSALLQNKTRTHSLENNGLSSSRWIRALSCCECLYVHSISSAPSTLFPYSIRNLLAHVNHCHPASEHITAE